MKIITAKYAGLEYEVYGDSIKINLEDNGDERIEIDNSRIVFEGRETTDFGENFQGHKFSPEEVAQSIIRAFINGSMEYAIRLADTNKNILHARLDIFEPSGFTVKLPLGQERTISKKYLGQYGVLPLQMVNGDYASYYSDGSEFVIVRKDGSLATDYEEFYGNAFIEDIENKNYLYLADGINPGDYI